MITEKEFFERLSAKIPRRTGLHENREDLFAYIKLAWEKVSARDIELHKELNESPRSAPELVKMQGLAYFYDLTQARIPLKDDTLCDNWVYDRGTETLIINLRCGAHQQFTAYLYCAYKGLKTAIYDQENSEKYITEGLGFYLSSCGTNPEKGEDVKLNAQEKIIFRGFHFRNI